MVSSEGIANSVQLVHQIIKRLEKAGFIVRRINLLAGGAARIRLATAGGLIKGVPRIEVDKEVQNIRVLKQRLFSSKLIAHIPISPRTMRWK